MLLLGAVLILLLYSQEGVLPSALAGAVILAAVLIRFGLLACAFCLLVMEAGNGALTTDWTAWHAQSEVMVLVALLAAYGFWAATAGRPLLAERDG